MARCSAEPVQVRIAENLFDALLLKRTRDGSRAFVTYELEGRVETRWVPTSAVITADDQDADPVG